MERLVNILLDVLAGIFVVGFLFIVFVLIITGAAMLITYVFSKLKPSIISLSKKVYNFFSWENSWLKPLRKNCSQVSKVSEVIGRKYANKSKFINS